MIEAKQNNQVRKLMMRWQKYELIALDEVGYGSTRSTAELRTRK